MRLLADGWSVAFTYSQSKEAAVAFQEEARATLDDDAPIIEAFAADVRVGAWSMSKAVLPHFMRQRRGAIVNVASLSGLHGVVGQTNYSGAKGGLISMSRSLAREVARSGIRVNCVAPGLVETDMISDID